MDIGVWMNRATLQEKLLQGSSRNPEASWNLRNWPRGFMEGGENRLFVACEGKWIGHFKIASDGLYNPRDASTPYTLLFDTRTWTLIQPRPAHRFHGFTYAVPPIDDPPKAPDTRMPAVVNIDSKRAMEGADRGEPAARSNAQQAGSEG